MRELYNQATAVGLDMAQAAGAAAQSTLDFNQLRMMESSFQSTLVSQNITQAPATQEFIRKQTQISLDATATAQSSAATSSTNLNKADIERMVLDAQRSASEDNRRRETIQSRNEADQAIYQSEKSLRDQGDKVSALDRGKIEAQINTLKETKQSEDSGRIRAQIAELRRAMMILGHVRRCDWQGRQPREPGGNGHDMPRDENVIEGEYWEM